MPISLVALKPVPVTVTVPPGAWAFVDSVIDPVADAVEMKAIENIESISKAVATVLLSSVFSYLLKVLWNKLSRSANKLHSPIVSIKKIVSHAETFHSVA
jgi:hypothetical protein